MKKQINLAAFTLIELLVVISIIAVLASIALPVFSSVQTKGAQTKALSNAKQIGLACKLYATDNNGNFPSYTLDANLKPTTVPVTTSNDAFAQLFPDYMQSEQVFYTPHSAFCPNPPDDKIDNPMAQSPVETLKSGENNYAYVLALNDTSNSAFPLIADGFAVEASHTYSQDQTAKGGVWKGDRAVVIFADISGQVVKCRNKGGAITVPGPPGDDMFTTAGGANNIQWLGTANKAVNPK